MKDTTERATDDGDFQANLLRVAKTDKGLARNRAFYLFFRKMRPAERKQAIETISTLTGPMPPKRGGEQVKGGTSDGDVGATDGKARGSNPWSDPDWRRRLVAGFLGTIQSSSDVPDFSASSAEVERSQDRSDCHKVEGADEDRFRLWLHKLAGGTASNGKPADFYAKIFSELVDDRAEHPDDGRTARSIAKVIARHRGQDEIGPVVLAASVGGLDDAIDLIRYPRPLLQPREGEDGRTIVPLFAAPSIFGDLLDGVAERMRDFGDSETGTNDGGGAYGDADLPAGEADSGAAAVGDEAHPGGGAGNTARARGRAVPNGGDGIAAALATSLVKAILDPKILPGALDAFGDSPEARGLFAFRGGLLLALLYQIMREAEAAQTKDGDPPPIRGEFKGHRGRHDDDGARAPAIPPLNIAFTFSGLEALQIHGSTLASFPDAFRQGMAARSGILGDVGPSAPEHWEGALGLKLIHGYLNFSYPVGDRLGSGLVVPEPVLGRIRRQVGEHTAGQNVDGRRLRILLNALYLLMGLKIVHIEFGEDPYDLEKGDDDIVRAKPRNHRVEHFGFRDGISQPFVDVGLAKPGGGDPRCNNTWDPIAPGEMLLDEPDVDGVSHLQPISSALRKGSTYVVFRKLEQDVTGFRAYLRKQHPDDPSAQDRLAAQFVGRWKSGVSLVQSPDVEVTYGADDKTLLNDFLYRKDDPKGRKCPLGAHARRSNPRDIGPVGIVRRHRILRRGISYGGPLLPEGSGDRSTSRGLLFVAVNARIETQFELIQSKWINGGEFLGQAGLERCPLTGANDGGSRDRFFGAGEFAPFTGIPRFVLTRGGDYFFAPGIEALRKIAKGWTFCPDAAGTAQHGEIGFGDVATPSLFDEKRVRRIIGGVSAGKGDDPPTQVTMPAMPEWIGHLKAHEPPEAAEPVVFVTRHRNVRKVLQMPSKGSGDTLEFSVAHYRAAGQRISRGHDLLVGTEYDGSKKPDDLGKKRTRMLAILNEAWNRLYDKGAAPVDDTDDPEKLWPPSRIGTVVRRRLKAARDRTGPVGRIDLVHDLAVEAVYGVVSEVFGVPGPDWLTELAIALPFAKQHFGQIHPDWLKTLSGEPPDNPNLKTLQIWSLLQFVDIIGNKANRNDLKALSLQAAGEMLTYIDILLHRARLLRREDVDAKELTLLEHFVAIEGEMLDRFKSKTYGVEEYYAEVRMLLLEIVGTAFATIPLTFGSVMQFVMDHDIDLGSLPMEKFPDGTTSMDRVIYEATRLKPNLPMLMRRCVSPADFETAPKCPHNPCAAHSGFTIDEGRWVSALVAAANLDCAAFPDPLVFLPFPVNPTDLGGACAPATGTDAQDPAAVAPDAKGQALQGSDAMPRITRHKNDYLLFGAPVLEQDKKWKDRNRSCWGRNRMALHILRACLEEARRLGRVHRVPGPAGEPALFAEVMIGLPARFPKFR